MTNQTVPSVSIKSADAALTRSTLNAEQIQIVEELKSRVNIEDSQTVINYGSLAGDRLNTFSENLLSKVKMKDGGTGGEMMINLVKDIRGFDKAIKGNAFTRLFKMGKNAFVDMKTKYDSLEEGIDAVIKEVDHHIASLTQDSLMLDAMYHDKNQLHKSIALHIIAGEEKIHELSASVHEETQLALSNKDETALEVVADKTANLDRFKRRVHDLRSVAMVAQQQGPQIRLIQHNDAIVIERLQSIKDLVIPTWRSTMTMNLAAQNTSSAIKSASIIGEVTEKMLTGLSKEIRNATVENAKNSEKSIINIEAIKAANQDVLGAMEAVVQSRVKGDENRRKEIQEMERINEEFRQQSLKIIESQAKTITDPKLFKKSTEKSAVQDIHYDDIEERIKNSMN